MHVQATTDYLWFKETIKNTALVSQLKKITLLICDVDGTLADAHVYTNQQGEGGRLFSTQDGFIVKFALKEKITIAFVSGKKNESTLQRAKILGIPEEFCICGVEEKITAIKNLQKKVTASFQQTLVFGDDILDFNIKAHEIAGLFVCPCNAPFYLHHKADLVIPRTGGNNAFRFFIDFMLFIKNKHPLQTIITESLAQ